MPFVNSSNLELPTKFSAHAGMPASKALNPTSPAPFSGSEGKKKIQHWANGVASLPWDEKEKSREKRPV